MTISLEDSLDSSVWADEAPQCLEAVDSWDLSFWNGIMSVCWPTNPVYFIVLL